MHKERLLVVLGPTAVGKTRLAVALAGSLGGEIVSADSAQVYRHMDIGTDKPPAADRARVPHHLIDIKNPDEDFNVAEFQTLAQQAIREINARGRLPILAGGTGLYIRAVVTGYALAGEGKDPVLRAALAERAAREGGDALHRELAALDPPAAAAIDPRNLRRVIRALEVYHLTSVPFSRLPRRGGAGDRYDVIKIGLIRDRAELYRRIEARVDAQLERGLVEEVRGLLTMGYHPGLPALQALGYKEVIAYLAGEVTYEEMVATLKRNTRRYAKRQETWFRREEGVSWFDLSRRSEEEVLAEAGALAATHFVLK